MANRTGLYGLDIIAQDSTVKASIDESGNIQADGTLTVDGASTLTGAVAVSGNLALSGNLTGRKLATEHHTAGDTLAAAESGSIHTNKGASGTITIVLPSAALGLEFTFLVLAAQELRIDPNSTQTIALPSTSVQGGGGKYLVADAVGEHVRLVCLTAGTWDAFPYAGTWTAEP